MAKPSKLAVAIGAALTPAPKPKFKVGDAVTIGRAYQMGERPPWIGKHHADEWTGHKMFVLAVHSSGGFHGIPPYFSYDLSKYPPEIAGDDYEVYISESRLTKRRK